MDTTEAAARCTEAEGSPISLSDMPMPWLARAVVTLTSRERLAMSQCSKQLHAAVVQHSPTTTLTPSNSLQGKPGIEAAVMAQAAASPNLHLKLQNHFQATPAGITQAVRKLSLEDMQFSLLDISSLAALPKLHTLCISNCKLSSSALKEGSSSSSSSNSSPAGKQKDTKPSQPWWHVFSCGASSQQPNTAGAPSTPTRPATSKQLGANFPSLHTLECHMTAHDNPQANRKLEQWMLTALAPVLSPYTRCLRVHHLNSAAALVSYPAVEQFESDNSYLEELAGQKCGWAYGLEELYREPLETTPPAETALLNHPNLKRITLPDWQLPGDYSNPSTAGGGGRWELLHLKGSSIELAALRRIPASRIDCLRLEGGVNVRLSSGSTVAANLRQCKRVECVGSEQSLWKIPATSVFTLDGPALHPHVLDVCAAGLVPNTVLYLHSSQLNADLIQAMSRLPPHVMYLVIDTHHLVTERLAFRGDKAITCWMDVFTHLPSHLTHLVFVECCTDESLHELEALITAHVPPSLVYLRLGFKEAVKNRDRLLALATQHCPSLQVQIPTSSRWSD